MNYQYIEQLIERYFSCQTTLQEEQILRSFFSNEDVPGHLMQYTSLFCYENNAKQETLGHDFDRKILAEIDRRQARTLNHKRHFAPLFRAAAIVAIIITVGSAADNALSDKTSGTDNTLNIDPYIRQADIPSTIKGKDIIQAENRLQGDSLQIQTTESAMQQ